MNIYNMGNTSSVHLDKKSLKLYDTVRQTIKDIIYETKFWADNKNNMCDKFVVVYYDKLIQYNTSEILDASMAIGIKHDKEINKEELCKKIVTHYKKRIELLTYILNSVTKMFAKLTRAIQGPVCQGVDEYVDDFYQCKRMRGVWLNEDQYVQILGKIEKLDIYNGWIEHIKYLNSNWLKYMQDLYDIIIIIKRDIDNTIDDDTFSEMEEMARSTIKKMNYICDIHYLLAINYTD